MLLFRRALSSSSSKLPSASCLLRVPGDVVRPRPSNSCGVSSTSSSSNAGGSGRKLGIHVLRCPDAVGIVAKISECIASHGGNIHDVTSFEFVFDPANWARETMDTDFFNISKLFNADVSIVRVPDVDPKFKIAVLASKQDHCLVDILHGWHDGRLHNHERAPKTHLVSFLERDGIPYHCLKTTSENKREEEILSLVEGTDFLVLARYMQVLSARFLKRYGKDVINIHHGLLPSFKGINPSRQAYNAGVKLIGATSHFVTEPLDEGPIIEQMKSEELEKQCLVKAIKSYCELRVLPMSKEDRCIYRSV
ncbi:unnamed protein product [Spirodela intermedia]|uniref:Formyl transferase N-terminal domain-containing protein n=1 Tax=Spirodela intermedia TaxID=51605 RepID=A0ABN7EDR4_SPIIN|nr:unnamed protein product [Spirodela intermedia]